MNNGYIYIMDYSDSTICEIKIEDEDIDKNIEEIIKPYGLDIDTCTYMYTQDKIDNIIELHKEY